MIIQKEHWDKDKAQVFKDIDAIKKKVEAFGYGHPIAMIRSEYLKSLEKTRKMFEDEMKKASDKWASPFAAITLPDDMKLEFIDPAYGTGVFGLSGVVMAETREPDLTIKVNITDHDGTPVDLQNCEVKIVDKENGIIEITKYKKVKLK